MSGVAKKPFSGKFTSTALSTGGTFEGGDRKQPLVVDKSNAQRQFKKPAGRGGDKALDSFNMFKPLSVNNTSGGRKHTDPKAMHSDPFADRPHVEPPHRKVMEPPRDQQHEPLGRKVLPQPVKDGQDKEKIITANGLVASGSSKGFPEGKHTSATTFDKELKKVDYAQMSRFKSSAASRKESINDNCINQNGNTDYDPKKSAYYHGGKKPTANAPNTNSSLDGVLRFGAPKPARTFESRPPWGTNETPRTPPTLHSGVFHGHSSVARNAPWATSATTSAASSVPQTPKTPNAGMTLAAE